MRLIDADYVLEACNGFRNNPSRKFNYGMALVEEIVKNAPTIDAKPIQYGHWEYNPKDAFEVMFELPKCSVCGHESSDALKYCPNCGAKIEEVEE